MAAAPDPATVIWRRTTAPPDRRWQRWAIPLVVGFVAFGAFASWKADDPESIEFMVGAGGVLIALMLAGPFILRAARRVDAELTWDGTTLRCGRQSEVQITGPPVWWVDSRTDTVHHGEGAAARTPILQLNVRHPDGQVSQLAWAYPHPDDMRTLREALTPVFGAETAPPGS